VACCSFLFPRVMGCAGGPCAGLRDAANWGMMIGTIVAGRGRIPPQSRLHQLQRALVAVPHGVSHDC